MKNTSKTAPKLVAVAAPVAPLVDRLAAASATRPAPSLPSSNPNTPRRTRAR